MAKTNRRFVEFDDEFAPFKRSSKDDRRKIKKIVSSGKDFEEIQEELEEMDDLFVKNNKRKK